MIVNLNFDLMNIRKILESCNINSLCSNLIYVCMYVGMYVCMYVCTYVCMYVCVRTYTVDIYNALCPNYSLFLFLVIVIITNYENNTFSLNSTTFVTYLSDILVYLYYT